MDNIDKYSNLNKEETQFILMAFALKKPVVEIKIDFQKLFEKTLKGEVLIQFAGRYSDEIKALSKVEMENIGKVPITHSRIRMEFIYKGLQEASTPKAVRSIRVGPTEYEVTYEVDHAAIAKYLQLAQQEDFLHKKLYYEILKNKEILGETKPQSGFKPIELDSGLNWDESELKSS